MIVAAPLLTRLYTPEDFGLLAVFTAILTCITVISSGRYEIAIPLPKNEIDAANLTLLSLFIVLCVTIFSVVISFIWAEPIATKLNLPGLSDYFWLIPLGVFFIGTYQVLNKHAVRYKEFTMLARTRIYQAIGTLGVQLGGYQLGGVGLLGGQALGQGLGLGGVILSVINRSDLKECSVKGMIKQAKRYKNFPIFSSWTALFNTVGLQFAPIAFVSLFGVGIAGLYALTLRILSMPASLVGNAVGSVFLAEAPQAHREGRLSKLVTKLHSQLAMSGSLPLVVLLFFGPSLFAFVFGEEWRKAGVYAQWMSPWLYLQFQWSPLSMLGSILELQRDAFIAQLLSLSVRIASLGLTYYYGYSDNISIFTFSVVSAIIYLSQMFWFMKKAGVSLLNIILTDVKYILISFFIVGPIWLLLNIY